MDIEKKDTFLSPSTEISGTVTGLDEWYFQLIQLVHLLGSAFVAPHFWKKEKTIDDTFDQLVISLNELSKLPGNEGRILIHNDGKSETHLNNGNIQYTVRFSNIIIDTDKIAELANSSAPSIPPLLKKLQIAFDIFSLNGINDLMLRLPNNNENILEQIRISLEILSHFDQSLLSDSDVVYHDKNQEVKIKIVKGADDPVDPNLTLVAAINNFSENTMADICKKVKKYIQEHLLPTNPDSKYNIFNAMFCVKGLKEKLILPPLEINNAKCRRNDEKNEICHITADNPFQDSMMEPHPQDTLERVSEGEEHSFEISNLQEAIKEKGAIVETDAEDGDQILELSNPIYNNNELKHISTDDENHMEDQTDVSHGGINLIKGKTDLSQKNINTNECNILDDNNFVERLKEATDLLASLENTAKGEEILNGIVASLHECLEKVGSVYLKDIINENGQDLLKHDNSSKIVEKFNDRIRTMLSRFRENSSSDSKTVTPYRKGIDFQKLDHKVVAKRFDLSVSDTKKILQLLEGCFDAKGYFIRAEFEMRIPQFVTYESKIFEFLWGYLNEPLHRNDRVAFLNSLYLLISNLTQPTKIMSFLLDELFNHPLRILYSDRNAFLLASLLLRNYNKELSVDIELTPGEVLLVKKGLNEDILHYASLRLEMDQCLVKDKLDTIHDRLIKAFQIEKNKTIAWDWDPHFLLSLEREAFIFISLVSQEPARQIIIAALSEYGNPKSKIYDCYHEERFMLLLLQQLKLLIRGLGRVGEIEDLGVLADLKKSEEGFIAMHSTEQHEKNVRQVFKMIDIAMGSITSLQ